MSFRFTIALLIGILLALSACTSSEDEIIATDLPDVSGGKSALLSTDRLTVGAEGSFARKSSLLGVYVAEYLSVTPALAAESAIKGVNVQNSIIGAQSTISDPDLEMLASFAEALSVDVAALLNRSTNRQESLDAYTEALNAIASRVNDRYRELLSSEEELTGSVRSMKRELADAERALNDAKEQKDYRLVSEKQKIILDLQKEVAEKELQLVQVSDLVREIGSYLELYGEKILAIERNREALIAGIKVTDVPGAEELQVIERGDSSERAPRQRRGGMLNPFDILF